MPPQPQPPSTPTAPTTTSAAAAAAVAGTSVVPSLVLTPQSTVGEMVTDILWVLLDIAAKVTDISLIDQTLHVLWLLTTSKSAQTKLATMDGLVHTASILSRIHCLHLVLPMTADGQCLPEVYVQAKALERLLSVLSLQVRLFDDLSQCGQCGALLEGTGLLLLSAPRLSLWFPSILLAAEIIQVLVLHPANADKFQAVFKHIQATHGMADSTPDSQMIMDLMVSIQHTLHGALRPALRMETPRSMDVGQYLRQLSPSSSGTWAPLTSAASLAASGGASPAKSTASAPATPTPPLPHGQHHHHHHHHHHHAPPTPHSVHSTHSSASKSAVSKFK